MYFSTRLEQRRQENRLAASYLLTLNQYYKDTQTQIERIRCYRHDLANHIQTLEYLISQKEDSSELHEYLGVLQKKYQQLVEAQYCKNDVVNVLLSSRKQHCEQSQISFAIDVENGDYAGIDEKDLAALLHNLLDNAIEACERMPEGEARRIHLHMAQQPDFTLEVANSMDSREKLDFRTKKNHKESHGYGIKIITDCVKRYHGKFTTEFSKEPPEIIQKIALPKL